MSNQPNIKSSAAEYLTFVASKGENYQNKEYNTNHYDLQMIIAIGFKVNSGRAVQLDQILLANKYELLQNAGRISMEIARQHAETEFEKYRIEQDQLYESDFDRFLLLEESVKRIEN
ncbi:hypothetical protein AGMMS50239_05830 [Bacteroidia bacterium]|nr:hypothetical protein AGMMS50239_05830 [Bacteroidia bacterium]